LGELAVDAQVGLVAEGVGAVAGEFGQVLVGRAVGPAVGDGHVGHLVPSVGVGVSGPKSTEYNLHVHGSGRAEMSLERRLGNLQERGLARAGRYASR
jgi:hypothetical protein